MFLKLYDDGRLSKVTETEEFFNNPDTVLKAMGFQEPVAAIKGWDTQRIRISPKIIAVVANDGTGRITNIVAHQRDTGKFTVPIEVRGTKIVPALHANNQNLVQRAAKLSFTPPTGFELWDAALWDSANREQPRMFTFLVKGPHVFVNPMPNTYENGEQCTGTLRVPESPNMLEFALHAITVLEDNVGNADVSKRHGFDELWQWNTDMVHSPAAVADWEVVLTRVANGVTNAVFGGAPYAEV